MRIEYLPIAVAYGFLGSTATAEETLICTGGYSVSVGMRAFEVRGRCGDPEYRETVRVPVREKGADGSTYVRGYAQLEYWRYRLKPGRPSAVLTFEGATLRRIDLIERRMTRTQ
jgi:hypothetical protein